MRLFFRGGDWNNTTNAGVFNLNGNNPRSNSNNDVGFRVALPGFPLVRHLRVSTREQVKGYVSRPRGNTTTKIKVKTDTV